MGKYRVYFTRTILDWEDVEAESEYDASDKVTLPPGCYYFDSIEVLKD